MEQELLNESKQFPKREENSFKCNLNAKRIKAISELSYEELVKISENEEVDTPFENELRAKRLNRLIFEQDQIINEMNRTIDDFHRTVLNFKLEKVKIMEDSSIADLYLITLYREILILKDFEDHENALSADVESKLASVKGKESEIEELKIRIKERKEEIEEYLAEGNTVTEKFGQATQNSKFFSFLRKVFRKKYKPPKIRTGDGQY